MRMPLFLLRRGDLRGILFAVAILAALIAASVFYPTAIWQQGSGGNFGPDWDCRAMPKGGPVCIKRPPRKAAE